VRDLARSVDFYRVLLGQEPSKIRPNYAKFETAEPPLNLALNETAGPTGPSNLVAHFGVQVQSKEAVSRLATRLSQGGLKTQIEDNVTCCYAVQNKVWATDPDGNKWEVFVVLDNSAAGYGPDANRCCDDAASNVCCS
jgi:catechol 2,3-dioxygenase-like lactoylglutathione lyase family enzyme